MTSIHEIEKNMRPVPADEMTDQPDVSLENRPTAGEPYEMLFQRRLARRVFLKGAAGAAAGTAAAVAAPTTAEAGWGGFRRRLRRRIRDTLRFTPIAGSTLDRITLPFGYYDDVVIRWGDSLNPKYPDLDTSKLEQGELLKPGAGDAQANQFGYNCDAVEYFPRRYGSENSRNGIVCCNHEYTNPEMKYPEYPLFGQEIVVDPDANETRPETTEETQNRIRDFVLENPEYVRVELAAHGVSVIGVVRRWGRWRYRKFSRFNRRITAETPIRLTGPAAGNDLLKTSQDSTGTLVKGTLNNCAGGATPWGTYLSAEENVDQYFGNASAFLARAQNNDRDANIADAHARLPLPGGQSGRAWEIAERRFDVDEEPAEALRFGWVVEVDPYSPEEMPKKRTAIGRFKHECATTILAKDGRCVVYSGDDARMEYIFKFVTEGKVNKYDRAANKDLLDSGTLYVAKFNDDGTGDWLPLVWGYGPLTAENGFANQAEVLIKARKAGDLLGATPMDRPEDVEANPKTKKVYVALTNNTRRQNTDPSGSRDFQGRTVNTYPDLPNPRGPNRFGHIMEMTEANNDNASTTFTWEIFMLCGDPETTVGNYLTTLSGIPAALQTPPAPGQEDVYFAGFDRPDLVSPIGSPDNISFDNDGNLWIVTDGTQPRGGNNGGFAVPTEGPNRGYVRQFMAGPVDAEVCGAEFTPDNRTWFLNIQHPGAVFAQFGLSNLSDPTSYWPDSTVNGGVRKQPRPSLVAVSKFFSGRIGS